MKKLLGSLALFLALGGSVSGQVGNISNPVGANLNVQDAGTCLTLGSNLVQQLPINASTTTVTLAGTFTATVLVRESNNGGVNWTTAATLSSAGTTSYSTNGFSHLCVDITAYTSGVVQTTILTGLLQVQSVVSGGSSVSPNTTTASIPGEPGLTAVPVTTGLMAEYRFLPTETCAGLLDYSGNSVNATGTTGTAPTIVALTGGCNFTGNGAIQLPASLNSAQTIIAYISFQGNGVGGNNLNAVVQGNGNGAATGGTGLALISCKKSGNASNFCFSWLGFVSPTDTNNSRIVSYSGNGSNTNSQDNSAMNGVGSIAVTMATAGVDTLYLNGLQHNAADFQRNPGSVGAQTTGVYQIGGACATCGQNSGVATWFNGKIYYVAFYSRALNDTEIKAVHTYMQNAMILRGVNPSSFATDQVNQAVFDGTSITAGNALLSTSEQVVLNGGPWNIMRNGASGFGASQILSQATAYTDPLYRPNANKSFADYEAGVNDTPSTQAVAANIAGFFRAYCNARHLIGWKCLVNTVMDRDDTQKNLLDTELRLRWKEFADGLIDIGASPMGKDGNGANTTLFADGIHPTQYGFTNLYTPFVQRGINALYGNKSFSEATTYVAAAAAATATTAGSETGNTITITFGATPANCQAGNMITLSGITPVGLGYNDTFFILTRSATQITAWSSVTGLGAITVQGTGSCPQMQDADVYAIVNFTGNYTLETCVGYTGQNIYIRNINAGAVTLVPMPTSTFNGAAETITGAGATPATLAANTTAILQSQLISSTNAGCNWVRLQ